MSAVPRRCARFPRVAVLALALLATAATAAPASSVPVTTAYVTNGPVNAMVADDAGRTYIGGEFSMVGPRTGNAIALTTTDDQPATGFPEISGGQVLAAAGDGAGGWFIGGSFTSVGGVARERLAHVLADRTLDATWNPAPSGTVRALVRSGDSLFVGGQFTAIGGAPRSALAKLSTSGSGAVVPDFKPSFGASVRALALSGPFLYVGGDFYAFGEGEFKIARVATTTGARDATWSPAADLPVNALAVTADAVFAGGHFTTIGGAGRNAVAKLSPTGTGAADATWDAKLADGAIINALATAGTDVFLGGQFTGLGSPAVTRPNLAKVSATGAGALSTAWIPEFDVVHALTIDGGALYVGAKGSATNLARLSTSSSGARDAWKPNPNEAVRAIAVAGGGVLAGGSFSSAGARNLERSSLARLVPDGSVDATWYPFLNGQVAALALAGTTLYVGGDFAAGPGRAPYLAKWSTTGPGGFSDLGWAPTSDPPSDQPVTALAAANGALYVGKALSIADAIIKVSGSGTAIRDTTWDPDVMGIPRALAASGSSLYIAGDFGFEAVDGLTRQGLAKLALTGAGAVDPSWDPSVLQQFTALLVSGDSIFVGSSFNGTVGGQPVPHLEKLSAGGTGARDPAFDFEGDTNKAVNALALSGSDLYIGGWFTSAGGQPHPRLARLSAVTGAVDATFTPGTSGPVRALVASPTRLFAGGDFLTVDDFAVQGLAVFDFTTPAVSLAVPSDGPRYRLGQVVNAAYSCSGTDGDAEIVTCTGTVASGSPIDTATAGTHTFTATATDSGTNADSKTVSYVVDASRPLIEIEALPGGASYAIGEQAAVSYSCSDADGDSDVVTCAGPVPSGGLLDTTTAGAHTFTVTASDQAGNATKSSVAYSVRPAPELPGPLTPLTPADVKKPSLTAVTISPSAFRAERSGSPTSKATGRKPKRGTRVTYKLSETAKVTFTIIRPKKGKTRAKTLGRFTVAGKAGANRFVFRGRVGGKTPQPGRYQLAVQAADTAGNKSAVVGKPFTVKR